MADNEQHEKKQFSVPSRDELIQQIKDLDQDIEHVTLNLIKCDFNATQNDIKKTFSDFNFVKVKNYNPGSFEVVFQMKIDAINFIRNQYDKKILARRFFIKMGRQQKQVVQDWTGVGYVPRQFKGPHKPHFNKDKPTGPHRNKNTDGTQEKAQQNVETKAQEPTKEVTHKVEHKVQHKVEHKAEHKVEHKVEHKQFTKPVRHQAQQPVQQPVQEEKKKEGKIIPKTQHAPKKPEYKKPAHKEQGEKKTEAPHHAKKQGDHHVQKKQETHKKDEPKKDQKKPVKKQEVVQKPQPVAQKKEQDDGWIVVGGNKNTKKR